MVAKKLDEDPKRSGNASRKRGGGQRSQPADVDVDVDVDMKGVAHRTCTGDIIGRIGMLVVLPRQGKRSQDIETFLQGQDI